MAYRIDWRLAVGGVAVALAIGYAASPGCSAAQHIIACDDCGVAVLNAAMRTQQRGQKQAAPAPKAKPAGPKEPEKPKEAEATK